jgi:hypothetical protein
MPKTNISKAYYRQIVDTIEHEPLIEHTTLSIVCFIAALSVLAGSLLWFAKTNPGNLVQTSGTVSALSTGRSDASGTISTFVSFDFTTKDGKALTVRQRTTDGLDYEVGQAIKVGYFPDNPNFARNLRDNRPDQLSLLLWSVPFVLMIWLTFVALFRHHARQVEIWQAAEAADSDE